MACGCEKQKEATPASNGFSKAVVEIKNPSKITTLRKVVIPASLGDETTLPPAVGDYRNVILVYEASKKVYIYSSDGIPTLVSIDTSAIDKAIKKLQEDLAQETEDRADGDEQLSRDISSVDAKVDAETDARIAADNGLSGRITTNANNITTVSNNLATETNNRQSADLGLQQQIDAISASSDVKDIVGTYAELEAYDTSTLGNNDIIKVLQDETQDGATTYYRWSIVTETFTLIGEEGPYYTKMQTDGLLAEKQDNLIAGTNVQIDGTTISATDTTYTAGTGLNLVDTTFSADTSVLQAKLTAGDNISINNDTISATDTTYSAGAGLDLTGTEFSIDDTVALKTDLPTVNNATLTIQKNGTDVATFTANSASNVSANITVPTDNAQLNNGAGYQTASDVQTAIAGKQNTLTAGNNIQISNDTISATNTTYSAGNGLNLTGTVFSADTSVLATQQELSAKQDALTAGTNITISNDVISATDTTYSNFTGATSSTAGVAGLVPAPTAGDDGKFLSGDGSWTAIEPYVMPIASSSTLGGIKVGTNLSINPTTGVLAAVDSTYSAGTGLNLTGSTFSVDNTVVQDKLTAGSNIQINGSTISATDTKYSAGTGLYMTGTVIYANTDYLATQTDLSGKQDTLTAGDNITISNNVISADSMVILSYGHSTWNDFITVYNANRVVYCRASTGANPGTGSQTRLAFMAYVNNETNPTQVEFQYYRSVNAHSDSQQGDQVFVYLLTNANGGTWSVTTRNAFSKVVAGTNMTSSYSNGVLTLNASVPTNISAFTNDSGYQTASDVATAIAGKQDALTAGDGISITSNVIAVNSINSTDWSGLWQ